MIAKKNVCIIIIIFLLMISVFSVCAKNYNKWEKKLKLIQETLNFSNRDETINFVGEV